MNILWCTFSLNISCRILPVFPFLENTHNLIKYLKKSIVYKITELVQLQNKKCIVRYEKFFLYEMSQES